jgi:tRNA pseudouridine55 synthase
MLIGKEYTKLQDKVMINKKTYLADIKFGIRTDSGDQTGKIVETSDIMPKESDIQQVITTNYNGDVTQTVPIFSAKKINGVKLYDYARGRKTLPSDFALPTIQSVMESTLINYHAPIVQLSVTCSKGTYIRALAESLGRDLGVCATLQALCRTQVGGFSLQDAVDLALLQKEGLPAVCDRMLRL